MLKNLTAASLLSATLGATGLPALADDHTPDTSQLQAALGGTVPDSIAETPVDGLFEVVIGSQLLYLSANGQFVIQGEVVDLASAQNLTENRQRTLRAERLAGLDVNDMIVFGPDEGEAKHSVMVFTDIDCGYCRKLHQEITSYNDLGIEVRYLAFPRAGLRSESYNKAVAAWCADDPKAALTHAKQGGTNELRQCDNPVEEQYNLGQQLGVRGTPSIFLSNGEIVPGYVPAERLARMLNNTARAN